MLGQRCKWRTNSNTALGQCLLSVVCVVLWLCLTSRWGSSLLTGRDSDQTLFQRCVGVSDAGPAFKKRSISEHECAANSLRHICPCGGRLLSLLIRRLPAWSIPRRTHGWWVYYPATGDIPVISSKDGATSRTAARNGGGAGQQSSLVIIVMERALFYLFC